MSPKTLPECLGARSEGFTATALLWNPEPPIIRVRHNSALLKVFTCAIKKNRKKTRNMFTTVSFLIEKISGGPRWWELFKDFYLPSTSKLTIPETKQQLCMILRVAVTEYPELMSFSEINLPKIVQGNMDNHGSRLTTQPCEKNIQIPFHFLMIKKQVYLFNCLLIFCSKYLDFGKGVIEIHWHPREQYEKTIVLAGMSNHTGPINRKTLIDAQKSLIHRKQLRK